MNDPICMTDGIDIFITQEADNIVAEWDDHTGESWADMPKRRAWQALDDDHALTIDFLDEKPGPNSRLGFPAEAIITEAEGGHLIVSALCSSWADYFQGGWLCGRTNMVTWRVSAELADILPLMRKKGEIEIVAAERRRKWEQEAKRRREWEETLANLQGRLPAWAVSQLRYPSARGTCALLHFPDSVPIEIDFYDEDLTFVVKPKRFTELAQAIAVAARQQSILAAADGRSRHIREQNTA